MIMLAHAGQAEAVRAALAAGTNLHAGHDAALYWAAARGHTEIVRMLMAAGADVHAEDDRALWHTAAHGHVETARVLLTHAADPVVVGWASAKPAAPAMQSPIAATFSARADVMTPEQRRAINEMTPN